VWLHSAVFANEGSGVIFGGMRNGGALNEIYEYQSGVAKPCVVELHWLDLTSSCLADNWTKVCCGAFSSGDFTGPSPVRRWGHSAVVNNYEVWFYGGSTQQGAALTTVDRYFVGTLMWCTGTQAG
jgi:hypothetical protein